MHILALNSSPRDHETSKTELVLQKFLEGARRAGAETGDPVSEELQDQSLPGVLRLLDQDAGTVRPKGRHDGSAV